MSYRKLITIGNINKELPAYSPMSYCLPGNKMDVLFQHGSSANQLDSDSSSCQQFTSQYCANNWDNRCDYIYSQTNNARTRAGFYKDEGNGDLKGWDTGDVLLRNTMERKYCRFVGGTKPTDCGEQKMCKLTYQSFDPTVAGSPKIYQYEGQCGMVCDQVDVASIDNDKVMNLALQNTKASSTILDNICQTAKATGKSLGNTKLAKYCALK